MVTFAQAQERADRWVNGGGEVAGGAQVSGGRLVIARDSGDTTLWPALPVGEMIRRYEEAYGTGPAASADEGAAEPQRVDLEATSFLLTPPQWLQEAADRA